MRPWGVFLCLLVVACRPAAEAPTPGPLALRAWWKDFEAITSVTGIAFRNPSNAPESLLVDGTVDFGRLAEIETHRAVLPGMAGESLGDLLFSSQPPVPAAACYIPHHIFLLQNGRGETVGVVEVCFACRRVETLPAFPAPINPDWIGLASRCESAQLGMGPTYDSAAQFAAELREHIER